MGILIVIIVLYMNYYNYLIAGPFYVVFEWILYIPKLVGGS